MIARTGTAGAIASTSALVLASASRPRTGTTRFQSAARATAPDCPPLAWEAACQSEPSSRSISPTSTAIGSPRAKCSKLAPAPSRHGSRQALPSAASIRSASSGPQLPAA